MIPTTNCWQSAAHHGAVVVLIVVLALLTEALLSQGWRQRLSGWAVAALSTTPSTAAPDPFAPPAAAAQGERQPAASQPAAPALTPDSAVALTMTPSAAAQPHASATLAPAVAPLPAAEPTASAPLASALTPTPLASASVAPTVLAEQAILWAEPVYAEVTASSGYLPRGTAVVIRDRAVGPQGWRWLYVTARNGQGEPVQGYLRSDLLQSSELPPQRGERTAVAIAIDQSLTAPLYHPDAIAAIASAGERRDVLTLGRLPAGTALTIRRSERSAHGIEWHWVLLASGRQGVIRADHLRPAKRGASLTQHLPATAPAAVEGRFDSPPLPSPSARNVTHPDGFVRAIEAQIDRFRQQTSRLLSSGARRGSPPESPLVTIDELPTGDGGQRR